MFTCRYCGHSRHETQRVAGSNWCMSCVRAVAREQSHELRNLRQPRQVIVPGEGAREWASR